MILSIEAISSAEITLRREYELLQLQKLQR
jgi:hypothetical protein